MVEELEGALSKITLLVALFALACSPKRSGVGGDDDGNGDAGSGGGSGSACASSMLTAQAIPLDIYVMLDQSSSMTDPVSGGGDKWQAVSTALDTFVAQPGLDGVAIGLQYFGVPAGGAQACTVLVCNADADCGASACGPCTDHICLGYFASAGDSCTASDYATAAVEIAPLPGVASAITTSIAAHAPTTGTPTSAALQGAIDHATAWAGTHAGDAVAVVLATDGDPEECDTSLPDINAIAAAGAAATPKILTFVIGVGADLSNLNGIAAAGGTTSAFLVDTNANVNQQFLDAMNAIRHSVLGCTYQIPLPSDGMPDYSEVNVVYTPNGTGTPETFPYVMNAASCPATGNAWYYDNAASPTQIILCTAACGVVSADTTGTVDISLGCATVIE